MSHAFVRLRRARTQRTRGQSLAEFALVAPILLVLVLLAIDFGRFLYGWVILQNAARLGANYAALHPEGWQGGGSTAVQAEYEILIEGDLDTSNCAAPSTPPAPVFADGPDTPDAAGAADSNYDVGDTARVHLTCGFTPLTPIISSLVGSDVQIGATSEFRVRAGDIVGLAFPTQIPPPPPPPTPTPSPSASPSATPSASPTPTPTPACLPIPNLMVEGGGPETVAQARAEWTAAGFTGPFTPANGQTNKTVLTQNPLPTGAGGPACAPPTQAMVVTHS